jgi:hypothetical protein
VLIASAGNLMTRVADCTVTTWRDHVVAIAAIHIGYHIYQVSMLTEMRIINLFTMEVGCKTGWKCWYFA